MLSFEIDMRAQAFLHMPDGSLQYVGLLEWYDGVVKIQIYSEGMFFKGEVIEFKFATAFCTTDYFERYEQSAFMFNVALYGSIGSLNTMLDKNEIEVPGSWGYFEMQDLYLDYYDNFIAMGITPRFKKYNATDFENNTWYSNNSINNGTVAEPNKTALRSSSFLNLEGLTCE